MTVAFSLRNLSRTFSDGAAERTVLTGVSLDIEHGEFVAVTGKSGSGKSTLLSILGGLDRGFSGDVVAFGLNLKTATEAELSRYRNAQIGFVFQAFHLLPHLTLIDNVSLPHLFSGKPMTDAVRTRAHAVLTYVGLADRADAKPAHISGGQRQRVALARALFSNPKALLCDEPTGNLDDETGAEVICLLERICAEEGCTIVAVTHDHSLLSRAKSIIDIAAGTATKRGVR